MKMRTAVVCVCALVAVPVMIRSQASSAGGPVPSKVGTISVQAAIISTAEGKQASAELQTQFSARSTELQNLQKQIDDLQKKAQSATLSDAERGKVQVDGERLSRAFQRKQQYFQDDLNAAQQDAVNGIGRKMLEVINQYAKDNGYAVILDTSSQQTPVVYAAPQVDVTKEIARLYDQSHPAKAAPAQAKPATPAAAPAPKP